MGKVVEKKKKGRPSLLDLQKRSLKLHQQNLQDPQDLPRPNPYIKRNSNPNHRDDPFIHTSALRSSRREPSLDFEDPRKVEEHLGEEDDDDNCTGGRRREKKLNFLLRLPSQRDSSSLNSGSRASDSNPEEENGAKYQNKRKINAVGGRSAGGISEMDEKLLAGTNTQLDQQGTQLDSGSSSRPLPDKKLLLFILDRLQKKDSFGVFSEPVDRDELPDYHDIINRPMDFGTVRDKLEGGAYSSLEQFEKDIFLICSNAMRYNSPDTIYFRQARSIQELAIKSFQNLRQDSDNSEQEPVVRRGRPPTKYPKKPLGRPPLDRSRTDLSFDATPVASHYDLRKTDKSGPFNMSEHVFHGSRKSEPYARLLAEQKLERNEEYTGSLLKACSLKHGKIQLVGEDNRRNTYNQFHGGEESLSVLSTFHEERKQLMAVGLLTEFGYARSLSRFAATIGPIAWKIASSKIKSSLPVGVKFGPGWVGETNSPPPPPVKALPFPSLNSPSGPTTEFPSTTTNIDKSFSSAESEDMNNKKFQIHPSSGLNGTIYYGPPMGKLVTKDSSFLPMAISEHYNKLNYGDLEGGRAETTTMMMDSDPPDLNVMFQTQQRSPTTVDASMTHPDLALQL